MAPNREGELHHQGMYISILGKHEVTCGHVTPLNIYNDVLLGNPTCERNMGSIIMTLEHQH